jgi:hypothetical protein
LASLAAEGLFGLLVDVLLEAVSDRPDVNRIAGGDDHRPVFEDTNRQRRRFSHKGRKKKEEMGWNLLMAGIFSIRTLAV